MDIIDAINKRRSINFFEKNKEIPEETLNKLLELANLSPSSMNLQPWEVIIVNDPQKKTVLRKCAFNQPKVEEASVTLIIIANPDAVEKNIDNVMNNWLEFGYIKQEMLETYKKASESLYSGINRNIFAVKNTSFFAMSIMLAAQGLGLETHPMDGFNEKELKAKFDIPEKCIVPLIIAVGYPLPTLNLLPRAFRRKLSDFVKYNVY